MTRWVWPRSLAGQLALLLAAALFVAQAINFALLLHERTVQRVDQAAGQATTRIVEAIDRESRDRPAATDRGRVRLFATDPNPGMAVEPAVADQLRSTLAEAGIRVGRISTAIQPLNVHQPGLQRFRGRDARRLARFSEELVIAVEQPGRGWLVQRLLWPRDSRWIVWRLIGQTLILYGIVLLPVLWLGRRISQPLRNLTLAAERFGAGDDGAPVAVSGPGDLAATIAAFNALRLRVRAMLDEKDRMLGALAHDLRTPLAALRVRIESVEDDTDRERMVDSVTEMNRTLDDILSLARLGRPSEPPVETDLAALVDAVVEDFRDLGEDVTFVEAERLAMKLRPALMRRAVRNLIENAVKYGHAATVSVEASPSSVAIVVADRGPGIPAERHEEVFDAFTRLETSRNRETGGIGLGLALARAIVRDAGGEVTLANRAEGGMAATITLPRPPQ
ncbi:sensor histidine kinase [Sphingomonas bacterium]|uniref:sensor histidine kinase n=1 Tax=Sphingomonas bacterium TaxID=1895847 RepID=UPI0020C681FF|nr:HAMP domain-containing sensor histidine kinase [Sphingomonas bacterium]